MTLTQAVEMLKPDLDIITNKYPVEIKQKLQQAEDGRKAEKKDLDALVKSFDENLSGHLKTVGKEKGPKRYAAAGVVIDTIKSYRGKITGHANKVFAETAEECFKDRLDEIEKAAKAVKDAPTDDNLLKKLNEVGPKWSNAKKAFDTVLSKLYHDMHDNLKKDVEEAPKWVKVIQAGMPLSKFEEFRKLDGLAGDARKAQAAQLRGTFNEIYNVYDKVRQGGPGRAVNSSLQACVRIGQGLTFIDTILKQAGA